jgi:DNA modification methylase
MKPYYETNNGKLYQGNIIDALKIIPDNSIDCVMTSPPYWNLRDYGIEGQIGLEPTFQEYIINLRNRFRMRILLLIQRICALHRLRQDVLNIFVRNVGKRERRYTTIKSLKDTNFLKLIHDSDHHDIKVNMSKA